MQQTPLFNRDIKRGKAKGLFMFMHRISQRNIGKQQIDISYDLVGILHASLLNDLQNGEAA